MSPGKKNIIRLITHHDAVHTTTIYLLYNNDHYNVVHTIVDFSLIHVIKLKLY